MIWLIKNWLPLGNNGMDTATEGGFKTIWGCWLAVSIASGNDVFGCKVRQGRVVIVDEETPQRILESNLNRFSQGLGYKNWKELPITIFPMDGFRFGRKVEMNKLLMKISKLPESPVFFRLDSFISMLPGGRQSLSENDCNTGEIIRDDLNSLRKEYQNSSTLLSAHSKKFVAELSLDGLKESEMVSLVRGHGSIVGEGCDTGFILKKISEYPEPTRFAIITKVRRGAIPMASRIVYIEIQEEQYGEGWAKLVEIPETSIPPSPVAKAIYVLFKDKYPHNSREVVRCYAFNSRPENKNGVIELLNRHVLITDSKPQTYILNPNRQKECKPEYLDALNK